MLATLIDPLHWTSIHWPIVIVNTFHSYVCRFHNINTWCWENTKYHNSDNFEKAFNNVPLSPLDTSSPNYVFEYPGDRTGSEEFNLLEIQAAEKKITIDTAAATATRSHPLAWYAYPSMMIFGQIIFFGTIMALCSNTDWVCCVSLLLICSWMQAWKRVNSGWWRCVYVRAVQSSDHQ